MKLQFLLFLILFPLSMFGQNGLVSSGFIYDEAPFPQCHASTLTESPDGKIIVAWFGGAHEKNPDVGIWMSKQLDNGWTEPKEIVNGVQHDQKRYPSWNPVLYTQGDRIFLYYKVGPNPREWWGEYTWSDDNGATWVRPYRLPEDIQGPVRNKPILLSDGSLLCGSSTEYSNWRVQFEITRDMGKTWELIGPIHTGKKWNAIQPTLLIHPDGQIQALCRTKEGKIVQTFSKDRGKSWSELEAIALPNPNSGIDAVTLKDGRHLLVYNHTSVPKGKWGGPRSPINVAISRDGKQWEAALVLEDEPGEYSYPAVIQSADGKVHITYTWRREKVKHVILDPALLQSRPIVNGSWPQ